VPVANWVSLYLWCVSGAVAGFILNARAPEYVGVSDILEKYDLSLSLTNLMVCDVIFFCVLGPVLMTGLYDPKAIPQAITLGLSWSFVIRGILNTAQTSNGAPDGDDGQTFSASAARLRLSGACATAALRTWSRLCHSATRSWRSLTTSASLRSPLAPRAAICDKDPAASELCPPLRSLEYFTPQACVIGLFRRDAIDRLDEIPKLPA
jgi:hypothetical protein